MERQKTYKNRYLSKLGWGLVAKELNEAFSAPDSVSGTIGVNDDDSWSYDSIEEFLAHYNSRGSVLNIRYSNEISVRIDDVFFSGFTWRINCLDMSSITWFETAVEEIIQKHGTDKETIPIERESLNHEKLRTSAKSDDHGDAVGLDNVFVVHGHSEIHKSEVELFLKELGLEPIVLHRQSDQGLTLIEKFERHSDVKYAIIILTPDDTVIGSGPSLNKIPKEEGRARQNVIFEWGFFVGKLGRRKVCCLHQSGTVLPSDVHGVVYKPFTNSIDEIKYALRKELIDAGLNAL